MTLALVLWFALSIACDVGGQLCLKRGADQLPEGGSIRELAGSLARSSWVTAGILIYVAEIFIWLRILSEVPLSVAFPIASLNFLAIAFASALLLNERVGYRQWLGAFLITCGVMIVARTT